MNINKVKKEVLSQIKPSNNELEEINNSASLFVKLINTELKKSKAKGEAFLGGSIAKNTLIKKAKYDIDLFVRFFSDGDLSKNLEKVLKKVMAGKNCKNAGKLERIKGSRDYFQICLKTKSDIPVILEIVPVLKVVKPEKAKNVTDLSYFHVKYILTKIKKNKNLADEIRLAKAFCYSANCYGAESYIKGFSGYSLEVLISYYKTFDNFVKNMVKLKDKEVIDPEKKYKKGEALRQINESKLNSPTILIDPTYKERNVLAALSYETFNKFKASCIRFLKSPNKDFFEKKEFSFENERKKAKKFKAELGVIEIYSDKDKEDIAAAKIVKFSKYLVYLAEEKGFKIFGKDVSFSGFSGRLFLIYKKPEKNLVLKGPPFGMTDAVNNFKKKYKKIFVKNNFVYAKTLRKISDLKGLIKESGKNFRDMSIIKIKICKD